MDTRLSQKEKELVAVGASIAAGCIPCAQYHLKEVRVAGATTEEVTQAVDAALCVKSSTKGVMEKIAYEALGMIKEEQPSCCAGPTDRMKELVSIAAAVAVNCLTNFHKHVSAARTVGVRDEEIQLVVGLAKMIRGKAMEKMDTTANLHAAPGQDEACCGPEVSIKSSAEAQVSSGCCAPRIVARPGSQPLQSATKESCC